LAKKNAGLRSRPTLDLEPLYSENRTAGDDEDDEDEDSGDGDFADKYGQTNLLGFVIRNLTNLFAGRHLYSLKHIKPNPIYIDTTERFDRMMGLLNKSPIVAWDTEGKNLTVLHNKIYTMQFSVGEDKGFVLPLFHPKTPFSPKALSYITGELKHYFGDKPPDDFKYLIAMNAPHDLTTTRAELKIPIIFRRIWEVTAGETCLDENIKELEFPPLPGGTSKKKSTLGNLAAIFAHYGNDLYFTMPFSKGQRGTIGQVEPNNPDALNYMCLDTQSLFGIHNMQLARSEHLQLGTKNYKPYFRRLVSKQMSNAVHSISHMQAKGVNIDLYYLAFLKSNDSPLVIQREKESKALCAMETVQKANRILLKKQGEQDGAGLFGKREPWVFSVTKPTHQRTLFFDVMELEPLSFTKKEKEPQVNKVFQKHYKEKYEEVMRFSLIQEINKIHGTYVKGWWDKMKASLDSLKDGRLRPMYGFFRVVTGRTNSSKPNLQQVPTRAKISKYIKRLFIASKGHVLIKFDYSAHEVRFWAIISGDNRLADLFRIGQKLRQEYRRNPTVETEKRIKVEGDVHIINVKHFFNKIVDKAHFLRDAIKTTIFGVIYKKGAVSLAKELNNRTKEVGMNIRSEYREVKEKLEKAEDKDKEALEKKLLGLKAQVIENKNEKPKTKEYAQDLIDRLFARYTKGKEWIDWACNFAMTEGYVYSPTGRRRNLYGVLTGIESIIAAMGRRGVNSPIQGSASEVSVTTARLVALNFYEFLQKTNQLEDSMFLPGEIEKFVHDALYSEVKYEHLIPYLYILQWSATYGVTQYYAEEFGWNFNIEPEIEIELGATEDAMFKWDFSNQSLVKVIDNVLNQQVEHDLLKKDEISETKEKIYAVLKKEKTMKWLNHRFPILGLTDVGVEEIECETV
jgi:hypothetical protein